MKHVLSAKQFSRTDLEKLFLLAEKDLHLPGKILAVIKDEGSTRTRLSFEVAMLKLGGHSVSLELGTSSVLKGESIEDTVRSVSACADIIALRHSKIGVVQTAALASMVPVINAGDGGGEHPTQALLDVYTIKKELGGIDGLTVLMVGDLLHSRTVHSLLYLLKLYDVRVILVSPADLSLPEIYYDGYEVYADLQIALIRGKPDVVYLTREQKERTNRSGAYPVFGLEEMGLLKEKSIVMHPLPRREEMDVALDGDRRSAYWRQIKNGVLIRKALIYDMLNGE